METSPKRVWDWTLAGLFVAVSLSAALRLAATEWSENLYFGEAMAVFGACLGLTLGVSRFTDRAARWLGLGYTLFVVPWWLTLLSEQEGLLLEKLSELGLRISAALTTVANGKTLDDPILFIAFITLTFWLTSLIGGFRLARRLDALTALLPTGLVILVVQVYDAANPGRIWLFALYLFLCLLLSGRVYYLESDRKWKTGRVFHTPQTGRDLTSGLLLTSALVIVTTWSLPLSISSLKAATEFWREFIRPLRSLREDVERALDPLDSPYGGRGGKADFYAESLPLGRGLPLSDSVMFRVQVPEDLVNPPPRFYWRGRVFTTYNGKEWLNEEPEREGFESLEDNLPIPDLSGREIAEFQVRSAVEQSLLYAPAQPLWMSEAGEAFYYPLPEGERDVVYLQASPAIKERQPYRVRAALVNPTIEDMQNAGTEYPQWVTDTYLQLPANFSPRIAELARQIAQDQPTPYDQARAITAWLRTEIQYQAIIPAPPANVDPLEWVLFENKQSFCVYFATSETLMLRSLGVPARMAVGFAEGELDEETNSYTVLRRDYHAWPEVYFPGIGWVEFEPTPSQFELERPINDDTPVIAPLEEGQPTPPPLPIPTLAQAEPANQSPAAETPAMTDWISKYRPALIWLGWILFLLALWQSDRRVGWVGRIPLYIESRAERSGVEAPRWVRAWAAWVRLPAIGRAYESVNFSLWILGHPQPAYVTAAERARRLTDLVPAAQDRVRALSEAHERAVYAGAEFPSAQARVAALVILLTTIRTRLIQLGHTLEERFSRPNSFR